MKRITAVAIAFTLLGSPAFAQTQSVSEQQAINHTPTIPLKINQGMNIKLPSGVLVYKGWLDDGTIAQVDGDRPFEQGVSVLHVVARKPGQTQLSLMARDSNGVDSLYVFKLIAGSKGASILNVSANPVSSRSTKGTLVSNPGMQVSTQSQVGADIFQQGIDVAISRGLLIQNSKLHRKLQSFTEKVGKGMPVDQAAGRTGLNSRTIEQLFNLGRTAPRPFPAPENEKVLVQTPHSKPISSSTIDSKVSSKSSSELEKRLSQLEKRVSKLDHKVSKLDTQQEQFLARLENLDVQQELFTAKIESLSSPRQNPKTRPIQITLQAIPEAEANLPDLSKENEVAVKALPVPSTLPVGGTKTLNNHDVANAIAMGLLSHPDTPYHGWLYMRYQRMIRKLRAGAEPKTAARLSYIKVEHVKSVLKKGGVNPQEAGL